MIAQAALFPGGLVFQTNFPAAGSFPISKPSTADGITATCSGAGTGNESPNRPINGGGLEWQSGGVGSWWSIQFEGLRRIVTLGVQASSPGQPTTFNFQGSNDGSSWTTLQSFSSGSTASYPLVIQPYLYFRTISTAVTDITRMGNLTFTFSAI